MKPRLLASQCGPRLPLALDRARPRSKTFAILDKLSRLVGRDASVSDAVKFIEDLAMDAEPVQKGTQTQMPMQTPMQNNSAPPPAAPAPAAAGNAAKLQKLAMLLAQACALLKANGFGGGNANEGQAQKLQSLVGSDSDDDRGPAMQTTRPGLRSGAEALAQMSNISVSQGVRMPKAVPTDSLAATTTRCTLTPKELAWIAVSAHLQTIKTANQSACRHGLR